MAKRENFTAYEILPEDLLVYLSHHGPHFNKAAHEFAVSNMFKVDDNGREQPISPYTKKAIDDLLVKYNVKLKNAKLYDATYIANMCKADYLGSSITTEDQLCKYIKDTLSDPDAIEGLIFNRWIADMKWLGIPIPWDELI